LEQSTDSIYHHTRWIISFGKQGPHIFRWLSHASSRSI